MRIHVDKVAKGKLFLKKKSWLVTLLFPWIFIMLFICIKAGFCLYWLMNVTPHRKTPKDFKRENGKFGFLVLASAGVFCICVQFHNF